MKKYSTYAAFVTVLFGCFLTINSAFSGSSVQVNADVFSTIVRQLSVTQNENLNFGRLEEASVDGTIIINPSNNVRTVSNPSQIIMDNSVPHNRGRATVSGQADTSYNITLPANAFFLSSNTQSQVDAINNNPALPDPVKQALINQLIQNNVNRLEVTNINSFSVTSNQITNVAQLSNAGSDTIYVGGTLQMKDGAEEGLYSGRIEVTVSY